MTGVKVTYMANKADSDSHSSHKIFHLKISSLEITGSEKLEP